MDKRNSILFLGDVVPYKPFKFKNNYKTVFNLECPITSEGKPAANKIILSVKENYLENIFNGNLLCICLGNNHILDYGKEGLESTFKELEKLKLKWFGINNGNDDYCTPLTVRINKTDVAFFSVVCNSTTPIVELDNKIYLSLLNPDKIIRSIKQIRRSVQRIVVYIHWGIEECSYPTKEDILIARKIIDSGADIVIGSHAHAPQAIEKYKNGIIAHNLGNFLMPQLKKMPSYFDEKSEPHSTYSKTLMLWNRTSWGLIIDMENMEYKIKKYIFLLNRIIELPFTPLDKYIRFNNGAFNSSYELILKKHLRRRAFFRKIREFIFQPHIPQKIKRLF